MKFNNKVEVRAKNSLVWKRNLKYRKVVFMLLALFGLIVVFLRLSRNTNITPELRLHVLSFFLFIGVIASIYLYRLYKATVTELTTSEIESEKIQIVASGVDKKERKPFIIISIIFGLVILLFLYYLIQILKIRYV